jgi:hypothetical protein
LAPRSGGRVPGDDGLLRGVEVRRHDRLAGRARLAAAPLDHVARGPEHRRHRADAHRHRLLHELAAAAHRANQVLDRQSARRADRAVLAEGVPGYAVELRRTRPEHGECGERHRQDRRLGVGGELKLVLGPFEAQARERLAERRVRALEHVPGLRVALRKVLPHPCELAPLAGEDERDRAHCRPLSRASPRA